jgi:deoxycytidylate deaminase
MYSDKYIKRYFKFAKLASDMSDYTTNKVGAVLVYKHTIISMGHNKTASSPIQKRYNKYRNCLDREYDVEKQNNCTHAEIDCVQRIISSFKGDLSKCSIFIYRQTKGGNMGLSKPCRACSKYLEDNNIRNIYYSNDYKGFTYERRNYGN